MSRSSASSQISYERNHFSSNLNILDKENRCFTSIQSTSKATQQNEIRSFLKSERFFDGKYSSVGACGGEIIELKKTGTLTF